MKFRLATEIDAPRLAEMNRQLIEDEGHSNPMNATQLTQRMRSWLKGEYRGVIFEVDGETAAYALYRRDPSMIHLRHFFVGRAHRRRGIGREAMRILLEEIWPRDSRIMVEVLAQNAPGHAFWQSMGFADYSITMERRQP